MRSGDDSDTVAHRIIYTICNPLSLSGGDPSSRRLSHSQKAHSHGAATANSRIAHTHTHKHKRARRRHAVTVIVFFVAIIVDFCTNTKSRANAIQTRYSFINNLLQPKL